MVEEYKVHTLRPEIVNISTPHCLIMMKAFQIEPNIRVSGDKISSVNVRVFFGLYDVETDGTVEPQCLFDTCVNVC